MEPVTQAAIIVPSSRSPPDLSRRPPSMPRTRPLASSARSTSPLLSTWHCVSLPANVTKKKLDPSKDFPPPPAFFPPPAPAAVAPPPASTAASLIGPRIFVLSPLPGNKYEVDRYFYSPQADVMEGDYATLLAFATHYAYPLAILQCPDLAAFQASNPDATTVVRPFAEVPAPIIERGRALMLSSAASAASPSGGSASSQSLLLPPSAGANAHGSSSVRGHDPPSVAAETRTSSIPVSRTSALPFPPCRPDPDGVDGPFSVFRMGGSRGFGSLGGPGGLGGMGYHRASARRTPVSSFSAYSSNDDDFRSYNFPRPIPETIPSFLTSPVLADNSCVVFTDLFPRVFHSIALIGVFSGFISRLCSGTHLV